MDLFGNFKTSLSLVYQRHENYFNSSIFVGGFSFDVLTLDRIDHWFGLVSQAIYLSFALFFLFLEVRFPEPKKIDSKMLKFIVRWSDLAAHFCFGALLSAYTLFYFKSASLFTSFFFMLILVALLFLNEIERVQRGRFPIRFILGSLCLSSYILYLVPILLKAFGTFPFVLSMLVAVGLYLAFIKVTFRSKFWLFDSKGSRERIFGLLVPLLFSVLYFLKWIPPVPLAISDVGIFHEVHKVGNTYELVYTRSPFKFWQRGDQDFVAREGDSVYSFVRIFAPTQLKETVWVHWMKKNPKGKWSRTDKIPLQIVGGRELGYRAYTYKENFQMGDWQVRFVTSDERELGRLNFTIYPDPNPEAERTLRKKLISM